MLLDEAVYTVKMDFNKRFLALREVKRRVCQQLGDLQGPLKETLSALGRDTAALTDPKLLPDEEPELRDQVCTCLHTKLLHPNLSSCLLL